MADDYPYIRAWGRRLGSDSSYIDMVIERARNEQAPTNAIHRNQDGTWSTTDDIFNEDARRGMGLKPLPNSVLPSQYTITIDVDWAEPGGVNLTLTRYSRQIYSDRFANSHDAVERALFEIRVDQSEH